MHGSRISTTSELLLTSLHLSGQVCLIQNVALAGMAWEAPTTDKAVKTSTPSSSITTNSTKVTDHIAKDAANVPKPLIKPAVVR